MGARMDCLLFLLGVVLGYALRHARTGTLDELYRALCEARAKIKTYERPTE